MKIGEKERRREGEKERRREKWKRNAVLMIREGVAGSAEGFL